MLVRRESGQEAIMHPAAALSASLSLPGCSPWLADVSLSASQPTNSLQSELKIVPVGWEAHGHDCSHVQISRLVHNSLSNHAAPLVHHREEDELDDVLGAGHRWLQIPQLCDLQQHSLT